MSEVPQRCPELVQEVVSENVVVEDITPVERGPESVVDWSSTVEAPNKESGSVHVDVVPRRSRREASKPAWMRSGEYDVEM